MNLDVRYHEACTSPSDINEHLAHFVDLCVEHDARTVIELGVRRGVSTVAWLYGLEKTDGHLWSVDLSSPPPITSDRWTFVQGPDLDVSDQLPDEADIVFIDTSHTYEHTLNELAIYSRKVRAGGRIVLHDTEVESPELTGEHDYPVKRAVEKFCAAHGLSWSNWTHNNGLGIISVGDDV